MDTECIIRWLDEPQEEFSVIIRSTEYHDDPDDDDIFFYGLSRNELLQREGRGDFGEEFEIIEVV